MAGAPITYACRTLRRSQRSGPRVMTKLAAAAFHGAGPHPGRRPSLSASLIPAQGADGHPLSRARLSAACLRPRRNDAPQLDGGRRRWLCCDRAKAERAAASRPSALTHTVASRPPLALIAIMFAEIGSRRGHRRRHQPRMPRASSQPRPAGQRAAEVDAACPSHARIGRAPARSEAARVGPLVDSRGRPVASSA